MNIEIDRRCTAVLIAAISAMLGVARVAPAQTLTTLVNFDGTNGQQPAASLLQGLDGNLYGTTFEGGIGSGHSPAHGTAFKVTPAGTLTTLFTFCDPNGCIYTGEHPAAVLAQARNGTFYGTAGNGAHFMGTIFTLTPAGGETLLYSFCAQPNCTDGSYPQGGLVETSGGLFYGTTREGGANDNSFCYYARGGCGTVFKITSSGALTTLYSFCSQTNCADGDEPVAGLVQGTDGNFYGTTPNGGNINLCTSLLNWGCGTVFKITPSGTLSTLHTFGQTDGASPFAGLIQGEDGNFYGTTYQGGNLNACPSLGCGTIFKVTAGGTFTTLYSFCAQANCADGSGPEAGLIQATDGNLYGTTVYGGTGGSGTIFSITPAGVLTTLHSFDGTDGAAPTAGLVQATNGILYGTTSQGGTSGTLFSLSVGLGAFVETLPVAGKVGAVIQILGTNLTGATSVTFNGTPAAFKVISASEIGTTVPDGATTGKVQVVTPSGTLTSNSNFRVTL